MAKKKDPKKAVHTKENKVNKEQNIALTYKFLKDGKTIHWIEDFFDSTHGLKKITVQHYLIAARRLIATESDMDIDFAGALHDSRYEQMWEDNKNAYVEWHYVIEESWQAFVNKEVVQKYRALLKALKQRENLYGLRDKDIVFALHSNITLTRDAKAQSFENFIGESFDTEKLNFDEKMELIGLLQSSYEGDLFDKKEYIEGEEAIDVVQVIPEERRLTSKVVKVEGIDQIKEAIKKKKSRVTKETASIKVIDNLPKNENHTGEDVRKRLMDSIRKQIKNKYK